MISNKQFANYVDCVSFLICINGMAETVKLQCDLRWFFVRGKTFFIHMSLFQML
jgi:hypothetical protein